MSNERKVIFEYFYDLICVVLLFLRLKMMMGADAVDSVVGFTWLCYVSLMVA